MKARKRRTVGDNALLVTMTDAEVVKKLGRGKAAV